MGGITIKDNSFYEDNLKQGDVLELEEYVNELFLSLEDINKVDFVPNEDLIEKCYYNAYLMIFNSFKLLSSNNKEKINIYLTKAAETLETLSRLEHNKLNKDELVFDSMVIYYISDNSPRAYVLTKENHDINLPLYKKAIFNFINKDFHNLRSLILNEINSEGYDEEILIEKLKYNEIDEYDALENMLSYSIFKTLNNVLNYLFLGDESFIFPSLELLSKYKHISYAHNFVDYWWVISVLEIIIQELYKNSLWNQLKPFYSDLDEDLNVKLKNYIYDYANRNNPIVELWPSQITAIPKIINDDENITIKMPTSAGKTFIAELLILKFFMRGNFNHSKAIYISPFKSLSNEVENSLKSSLTSLDLKISNYYGGFESNDYEQSHLDELDILIVTPEKFDILLRTNPHLKDEIGLIIVDEGHIMGTYDGIVDKYSVRSTTFEFFMYRLKNLFKNSRIAFISGVLSNIEDFSKWLSGDVDNLINEEWKPTNIYVGTIQWYKGDKSYIDYFYKNNHPFSSTMRFEFLNYFENNCFANTRRRNIIPHDDNEALALTAIEFAKEAPTYVYAPKKIETTTLADKIIKLMKNIDINCYDYNLKFYDENDDDIVQLKEIIKLELGNSSVLLKYLDYGFIIHHADLPNRVKVSIETILRNRKINLVIATSTLVQGVNFPFKTIIFKGLYTPNLIDYSTFYNICGRAGRANEENNGRVLMFLGNIDEKNEEDIRKLQEKFRIFNEFFSNDTYNLKSIINPILKKIRRKQLRSKCSYEEYCFKLIEEMDISNVFDKGEMLNINSIDAQLLAFIEEEEDDSKLLENFINVSLHHVQYQYEAHQKYLKGFINSRLSYLKREFSTNSIRSRAYNMGLSLIDCKYIEENYDELKELFFKSKDWNNFNKFEKYDLLLEIGLKMLELDTLYYDEEVDKINIIRSWISNIPILDIMLDDDLNEIKINKFINFCRNMIPWAINSILNFFKLKEPSLQVPKISEYFSEMFKYGIFDLKVVILMPWANNNYEFCKKLSEYIENEELDFNTLFAELEVLYVFLQDKWSQEELKKFGMYLYPYSQEEIVSRIIIKSDIELDELDNNLIFILKNTNNLSLYDLEGNFIQNIDEGKYRFIDLETDKIEGIWKTKYINENTISLTPLKCDL